MIRRRFLSIICTIIIGSTILSTYNVKAAASNRRLWGNDRYQTCSTIVSDGWDKTSDYAVVVNGENFPDALSASTLAKKYNAPILLTENNELNENAYSQLKRLKVGKVVLVGGEAVIKTEVEEKIKSMGVETKRYKGQDRSETSVKVAEQIGTTNGIIVTTCDDYADALSVAPIAAKLQLPIILVPKDTLPDSVKNFISSRSIPKTYILGGTDIISDTVASQFPSVQRIEGKDKYERNINIINAFKFTINKVYLAYSEKFADALSCSPLAALQGNPILLIGDTTSSITRDFVRKNSSSINEFIAIGGTAGIKEKDLEDLLNSKNSSQTSNSTSIGTPIIESDINNNGSGPKLHMDYQSTFDYPDSFHEWELGPEKTIYIQYFFDVKWQLMYTKTLRLADDAVLKTEYPDGKIETFTPPALSKENIDKFNDNYDPVKVQAHLEEERNKQIEAGNKLVDKINKLATIAKVQQPSNGKSYTVRILPQSKDVESYFASVPTDIRYGDFAPKSLGDISSNVSDIVSKVEKVNFNANLIVTFLPYNLLNYPGGYAYKTYGDYEEHDVEDYTYEIFLSNSGVSYSEQFDNMIKNLKYDYYIK